MRVLSTKFSSMLYTEGNIVPSDGSDSGPTLSWITALNFPAAFRLLKYTADRDIV